MLRPAPMLRPAILLLAISLASCGKDAAGPPSGATTTQSSRATTEPPRQDAAKPTPVRPDWLAASDKFAAALTLSDAEAARLKTAFEARERVISQWTAEKGEQLKQLEREMQAAAKARDLATVSRLKEQARPLRDERTKRVKSHKDGARGARPGRTLAPAGPPRPGRAPPEPRWPRPIDATNKWRIPARQPGPPRRPPRAPRTRRPPATSTSNAPLKPPSSPPSNGRRLRRS